MNLNFKFIIMISIIAYYIEESARTNATGVVVKLRKGIAMGICSYSVNYFETAQIQPPLRDSALFPESDQDRVNCVFLKWELFGREVGNRCQDFKCVSPQGVETRKSGKSSRIVGGSVTEPHEFPHMVTIFYTLTHSHSCGGTIINANTILTAAHCVPYPTIDNYDVYAGKHNLSKEESSEQKPVIKSITTHEDYEPSKFSLNDIALIKLERPLNWTREVQPALLPAPDFVPRGECIATGWGLHYTVGANEVPDVPSKVTLEIVPLEECREAYASEPHSPIYDTVLCAGKIGIGCRGICNGDSGGPLGFRLSNGSFMLGAIVSAGLDCGHPDYPDVYTDVTKYIKWIQDNMQ